MDVANGCHIDRLLQKHNAFYEVYRKVIDILLVATTVKGGK